MKHLFLVIFLAGCSLVAPKFDNQEYATLVSLRGLTERTDMCSFTPNAQYLANVIKEKANWLYQYNEYLPNNAHTLPLFQTLKKETDSFNPTTIQYCKDKLGILNEEVIIIQKVLSHDSN